MGLKEIYHGLEDQYYSFLDTLDKHGIPVYSVVDAVEAQNIPSFPIAIFALLIVVGGLFVVLSPGLIGSNGVLSVTVYDETQNPITGITVKLSGEGLPNEALNGRITDSSGQVVFTNLPVGVSVQISASSPDYTINSKTIVLDQGDNETALAALAKIVEQSITLQLYKPNSTESFTQPVSLSFACSANAYTQTSTVNGGVVTLEVPSDCGTLTASSNDPTVTLQSSTINLESNNPTLYLSSQPTGNAVLQVSIVDEQGNPVSGIVVALKSKFGDQIAQKFSDGGVAEFSGLVPDTYDVFIPSDGIHAELDSGPFQVDEGTPVVKTFTVVNAAVGEVRVQVVDESTLAPVASAKVTLFRGNQLINTKTTNEGGQVTFAVSSGNNLTVSIDHPAYLIKTAEPVGVSSAGYTQIGMTKATPQNSQIVTVKIIDELGQPVENAYVALKKSPTGASVGPNKITGASGTVVFVSLEEGTYFASAYKPGFSDQIKSDVFVVKARENTEITVKLVLGTGTVALKVLGSDGQPLAGATVQPIDGVTHDPFGTDFTSGVDGIVELTLRADKYAYFRITEPNHLPYTTIPVQLKKGITQNMSVQLVKDVQKLEVKLLGTFVNGDPVLDDAGLAPGQMYTLRLGLYVPKNSTFNEAGIHVRTGNAQEGQTNPIENDDWFIRDVRGPYAKLQKGTTYTPPVGLGTDTQHLTSGDAKWANVVMNPIEDGVTQIEVDVQVKDTATQGADLPLYYRAWGKGGSYVRFPVDAVLGGSDSVSQKQGLYATTNLKLFSIGAGTHICSQDFCLGLVAEDLANGIQTDLTDDYQIDVSTKHKLLFTFTSISDNVLPDSSLILKSSSGSANLGAYDVTNAVGAKKTGVITGNKSEIPVGVIQKNNVVFGFVNFDAQKEGTAKVTLSLVSNKKELFTKDVLIKVDAAGEMSVDVTPKAILPLLVNQLLIHVVETNQDIALENANVTVSLNGTLLTSGFTDVEGVFPFELHEPNVNDTVDILVEKPGFKPINLSFKVGSDILTFIPSSISETLIVNGTTKKTRDVHILNLASIPLVIKEVTLSGDFQDLVKFDLLNDELLDSTLGVNGDANMTFSLSLTEKGQSLLVGKNIKGSVLVKLDNEQTGKTFTGSLPLNLKIGFGGEVDVEDCLLVQPTKWDLFTDTKTLKQLAFEIKNTCTVQGNPIKLVNLSAKVKQFSGDAIGTFQAATGEKTVDLGPEFKVLAESVPAAGESTVTITFDPAQIKSGSASPQIVFQATNLTDSGIPDLLSETVNITAAVNNLKQCVQVKTPSALSIDSCGINTGFGQQGNYYNQVYRPTGVPYYNPSYAQLNKTTNPSGTSLLPSNQSGVYGNSLYSPVYGAGGYDGYGAYSNINQQQFSPVNGYNTLNGYYGNPYVDRYNGIGGGQFGGFGCGGGTEIRVENSCQSEIEINLDVDPNLQTDQTNFILKPNENQRVRVFSGYRIGRYDIAVNARTKGSTDASKEIELVRVLVKSPTEINADCIQLDRSTFRFNDFIQKPVKAKVINKCYDQGVRLVESADTITIASFFNVDGSFTADGKGTEKRPNTLVHDIQVIGMQTRGVGDDTYQEIEFQIFPDLSTYKAQPDLLLDKGATGQRFSDLKLFAESNYYRVESYGTISVKYLDAFGGSQQKPFAVIFENLFNLASAVDALLQGGSTKITKFQDCINKDALNGLSFGDESFLDGTTITYPTKDPNSLLKTGQEFCGTSDYLGDISQPVVLKGKENPLVQATFRTIGKHDVQVTIVRPKNTQGDVTLEGTLATKITRVYVNPGTQDVSAPIKITVLKPGKTTNVAAFAPLTCGYGYEKSGNFLSKYGFDKLKWDWTFDGSPDCTTYYCDSTQVMIYTIKKIKKLDDFIQENRNKASSVFADSSVTYDTETFLEKILDKATIKSYDFVAKKDDERQVYLAKDSGVLLSNDNPTKTAIGKILDTTEKLKNTPTLDEYKKYLESVNSSFDTIKANHLDAYMNAVILLDKDIIEDPKNTFNTAGPSPTGISLQKIATYLHAEPLIVEKQTKYYVWTLAEYHQMVKDTYTFLTTPDATGKLPNLGLIGYNVDGSGTWLYASHLKAMVKAVKALRIAYYITPGQSIFTDKKARDYLLNNAKFDGDFTWSTYGSAQNFIDEVLENKILLVKDKMPVSLPSDFVNVNGGPYFYSDKIKALQVNNLDMIVPGITFVGFADKTPGQYTATFNITWSGKDGWIQAVKVNLSDKEAKVLKDLQPQGADYTKNPFFSVPFDGSLSTADRSKYGSPYYIDPATGKVLRSGVSSSELTTLEDIAQFSQNNGDLPVLFQYANGTITTAPHVPIPLKLRYGGAQPQPSYQYALTVNGTTAPFPTNVVKWYDCTSTLTKVTTPLAGGACNSNLNGPQSQSLTQSLPGEYFYTGMILLPPTAGANRYGIVPLCAKTEGDLKFAKNNGQVVSVGPTPDTQTQFVDLDESFAAPAVQKIPYSLSDLLQYVQEGKACAKVDGDFTVIWDLKSAVPDALTCNSK